MNDYLETRELYHFGIKGQKWGVRRFENEDGTLTRTGKRHYLKEYGKLEDQYTYGKNENKALNAELDKKMADINAKISNTTKKQTITKSGKNKTKTILKGLGIAYAAAIVGNTAVNMKKMKSEQPDMYNLITFAIKHPVKMSKELSSLK